MHAESCVGGPWEGMDGENVADEVRNVGLGWGWFEVEWGERHLGGAEFPALSGWNEGSSSLSRCLKGS